MSTPGESDRTDHTVGPPKWRRPVLLIGKVLLVAGGVWLAVQALAQVDWAQVGDALGRLTWWEIVVVAMIVALRQTVNASTLVILLPGLRLRQALTTALSGTLIQTFTPPPSDAVLRMSILRSYGVEATRGAAALVLDTLVFYLARFVAPMVGLVLAVIALPVMPIQVWMAVGGAAVGAALVGALIIISRGERAAGGFGRTAAVVVQRLRPSIDPDGWSAALVRFQQQSAAGLFRKIVQATPTMIAFIVVDGIVLVASLRFVGIPGEQIGYLAVLAGLLSLYPLTIFPFAGLGVLDAALIVLINAEGVADPADLIAAMV
ncbi:MAG: lysylphosphatidylglycerol synthase domain-containing protein, partial [Nakamurella sp.]